MAKPRKKAVANWKITVEVEAGDAYSEEMKTTTVSIEGSWQRGPRSLGDGPLRTLAVDMGAIVKMLDDSGKLVPGGNAVEGFTDGFSRDEDEGSQE